MMPIWPCRTGGARAESKRFIRPTGACNAISMQTPRKRLRFSKTGTNGFEPCCQDCRRRTWRFLLAVVTFEDGQFIVIPVHLSVHDGELLVIPRRDAAT